MPLSATITRSWNFPAARPVTLAALRLGALPSISIAGSVGTGDIAAGAITPALTSPGAYFYGALSGTNSYTVTLNPALTAYANGVELLGKVANSNTSAAVTLDVNGLGAKNVYHRNGQQTKPGDLVANDIIRFRYNTSRNAGVGGFDIMEVLPSATIRPAVNVTTGTANAQAVVNVPPLTAYAAGLLLLVTVGASLSNTAALTLNCDGLGVRNVRRQDGTALLHADWVAGQTYLLYDDGTQFILLGRMTDVSVVASVRNLTLQNNLATPASQVDVSADEVVLKTTDGRPMLASTVSLTINIASGVALNGLETGVVEAASTWYYIWLISDGTNVRGVLEDAGSGDGALPLGPDLTNAAFAGYVYKALVGAVRNDGSSNFVRFVQRDRRVWVDDTNIFTATAAAVDNTWEILAGASLTALRAIVPPNGVACSGSLGWTATGVVCKEAVAGCNSDGTVNTTNALGAIYAVGSQVGVAWNVWTFGVAFEVPVRGAASRNIQWKADRPDATGRSRLNISGYTI